MSTLNYYNRIFATDKFYIGRSSIPGVGYGAFAAQDISGRTLLAEYIGNRFPAKFVDENPDIFEHNLYLFEVKKDHKIIEFIDASKFSTSNWTRFINGVKKQYWRRNAYSYQMNGRIYIKSLRDIKKNEEILIWYGTNYWNNLSLNY